MTKTMTTAEEIENYIPKYIPDIDLKITLLDEKKQQYALINKWIEKKSATEDMSKYIAHAADLGATVRVLEYDIKNMLGDDENELIYWGDATQNETQIDLSKFFPMSSSEHGKNIDLSKLFL